jgi:hypothetical protein
MESDPRRITAARTEIIAAIAEHYGENRYDVEAQFGSLLNSLEDEIRLQCIAVNLAASRGGPSR